MQFTHIHFSVCAHRLLLAALVFTVAVSWTHPEVIGAGANSDEAITHWIEGPLLSYPNYSSSTGFGKAMALGDINADGAVDIVVGAPAVTVDEMSAAGQVLIFYGPDFQTSTQMTAPDPAHSKAFGAAIALADLNGDGSIDMVVGATGGSAIQEHVDRVIPGKVHAYFGPDYTVTQTIQASDGPASWGFGGAFATGDLTGDSIVDLIVGDIYPLQNRMPSGTLAATAASNAVSVYAGPHLNLERSFPSAPCNLGYSCSYFGETVATGDLNGDGQQDLLVGGQYLNDIPNARGSVSGFLAPSFLRSILVYPTPSLRVASRFGRNIAVADLDNDGTADLIAGDPGTSGWPRELSGEVIILTSIFESQGGSNRYTLTPVSDEMDIRFGEQVAAADIDGDGYSDIMTTASQPDHHIALFRGPDFVTSQIIPVISVGTLNTADLDADGRADLVVLTPDEHLRILYSRPPDTAGP